MNGNQYQNTQNQNDPQMWGQEQYHQPPRPQQPKKKKKWLPWVLGGVGVMIFFSAIGGGGGSAETASVPNTSTSTTAPASAGGSEAEPVTHTEAPAEPAMEVSAGTLIDDLTGNALKAKTTYEDKRVTVSGYVGNIDASGKYFTIDPKKDDFILTGIQVYTQNDEQVAQLAELSKNSPVTVTGTVTSVGEIMGYSIDIETIN